MSNCSDKRILIKNGQTVNEHEIRKQDVYVEDGIIKQLGCNLPVPDGTKIIDAADRYVIPGGIDPHTHFQLEFMGTVSVDDFYIGTKAAIAGGTTMIIDFIMPKVDVSLLDAYAAWRKKADGNVCCDYGLHMCLMQWNDKTKEEMGILCKQHGINSFKMFMTYSFMLNDYELYSAFEVCKELGALPQVHAENGLIIQKNVETLKARGITTPEGHALSRPEEVEAEAVNRACTIAQQVGSPLYVVHIMSKSAVKVLQQYQGKERQVFGETLAAALACDGSNYKSDCFEHAAGYVLSPPLRSDPSMPDAMMDLLAKDVLQLTGTDHCTFTKEQKRMGLDDFTKIPNGVNGVEERMCVLWEKGVHSGIIDPCRFVAISSTNAAKIFNLHPKKGCIAIGSDADIVIWNPNRTKVVSARTHNIGTDFNIFEGMEFHGVAEYVLVRGTICVEDEQLKVVQGHGNFVETPAFAPFIYEKRDKNDCPST